MAYLSTDPYAGTEREPALNYGGGSGPVSSPNPVMGGPAAVSGGFMGGSVPVNQIGAGGATVTNQTTAPTAQTAQLGPNATPQQILAFINQYAQAHGIQPGQSPAVTRQIVDALKAAGVNVDYETPDEYGRSAGLLFNGQPYKIVNGSDQWMFDSYLNAEGANPGTRPAGWNGGMGFGNGYGNMFGNSGAGGQFNPPGYDSLKDYPGYEFAFNEGLRGIQNSAASKGTLLTGGTMKEIGNYLGGSLAMPAYQQQFKNALDTHNTNFSDLFNLAGLGKP